MTIFGNFYLNFEMGHSFYQTMEHSLSSSSTSSIHAQSCSSNPLPDIPPFCQRYIDNKNSLFCYFPQGFGSDAVCGPNLQCGPIWALTHFPVFYQNDLLWFSREIYIPTPVTTCFNLKVTINFACLTTEQIKENVGIAHFCQCISGT